jgi:hypothetical protein
MNTRFVSLRALHSALLGVVFAAVLGLFLLPAPVHAAAVTSWTQTTSGSNIAGLNTASPVFGNGTTNSGNGYQMNATLPSVYTLAAVGDSVTFSGSAAFSLNTGAASDQFRVGLFSTNGSGNNNGWLGYFATNSGSGGNPNGRLWERKAVTTTAYFNNDATLSADERQAFAGIPASTSGTSTFLAGTYTFSIGATRTSTGLSVSWSIIGTGGTTYSISGTYADSTPQTYSFDRVGLMTGGGLNADQISFSSLDVTYSAVPEPASWGVITACLALGVVGLRRRARA